MQDKHYISTTEAARILRISRIAVFKKIKSGQLKAQKVGRNFMIDKNQIVKDKNAPLTNEEKAIIDQAVKKTVKEYGETLKLLANA